MFDEQGGGLGDSLDDNGKQGLAGSLPDETIDGEKGESKAADDADALLDGAPQAQAQDMAELRDKEGSSPASPIRCCQG